MEFSASSDRGLVRKINQDSFGYHVTDTGVCFLIVADGMGGYQAGEVASAIAVNSFIEAAKADSNENKNITPAEFIRASFKKANDIILNKAEIDDGLTGMGTTAVAAIIADGKITIGNTGDSRAYMIYGGASPSIKQITVDHSYVALLVEAGSIDVEEARTHPRRNEITKALGVKNYHEPDIFTLDGYRAGDTLILCSDGLNKMISDDVILKTASEFSSADEICERLTVAANENGGTDNITVVAAVF